MRPISRVFVSHSSQDDAFTRAVVEALRVPGEDLDPKILVDYNDLHPGKEWADEIHEWMLECHAAVVLLSPAALDDVQGRWVLKEATILSWRAFLEPDFQLFWVGVSGIDVDSLSNSSYSPLQIDRIQAVKATTPEEIGNTVRSALRAPPNADGTPLGRLTAALTSLLQAAGASLVRSLAGDFGLSLSPTTRLEASANALARRFVRNDVVPVHDLLDRLSPTLSQDVARRILNLLGPLWVEMDAAGKLPLIAAREPKWCAGIPGARIPAYTSQMYVRRAHGGSARFTLLDVSGGTSGDLDFLSGEICREVHARFRTENALLATVQGWLSRQQFPVYASIPGPAPDDRALTRLRGDFRQITFLFSTGSVTNPSLGFSRVEWIEPPADAEREQRAFDHWIEALQIIERLGG